MSVSSTSPPAVHALATEASQLRLTATCLTSALELVCAHSDESIETHHHHYEDWAPAQDSLEEYVVRVAAKSHASPASLIAVAMLLDRWRSRNPGQCQLATTNVRKLFLAGLRVATKMLELRTVHNDSFAAAAGIPTSTMGEIEACFLHEMDFNVHVLPAAYLQYAALFNAVGGC